MNAFAPNETADFVTYSFDFISISLYIIVLCLYTVTQYLSKFDEWSLYKIIDDITCRRCGLYATRIADSILHVREQENVIEEWYARALPHEGTSARFVGGWGV